MFFGFEMASQKKEVIGDEAMIERALSNRKVVISVIGDHAGLSVDDNYKVKKEVFFFLFYFFSFFFLSFFLFFPKNLNNF